MLADAGGHVLVRASTGPLPLQVSEGMRFNLLEHVQHLHRPGEVCAWPAVAGPRNSSTAVEGIVCAMRKSDAATATAEKKLRDNAISKDRTLKPETLEFAKCVIVFTIFPLRNFPLSNCRNGIGFDGRSG